MKFKKLVFLLVAVLVVTSIISTAAAENSATNLIKEQGCWVLNAGGGQASFKDSGELFIQGNPDNQAAFAFSESKVFEQDVTIVFSAKVSAVAGFLFRNHTATAGAAAVAPWAAGKPFGINIAAGQIELKEYVSSPGGSVLASTNGTFGDGKEHTLVVKSKDVANGVQVTALLDGEQVIDQLVEQAELKGEGYFSAWAYGSSDSLTVKSVSVDGLKTKEKAAFVAPVITDAQNLIKVSSNYAICEAQSGPGTIKFDANGASLTGGSGGPAAITFKNAKVGNQKVTVKFNAKIGSFAGIELRNKTAESPLTGEETIPWVGKGGGYSINITPTQLELKRFTVSGTGGDVVFSSPKNYADGKDHIMQIEMVDTANGVETKVYIDGNLDLDYTDTVERMKGEGYLGAWAMSPNDTLVIKELAIDGMSNPAASDAAPKTGDTSVILYVFIAAIAGLTSAMLLHKRKRCNV